MPDLAIGPPYKGTKPCPGCGVKLTNVSMMRERPWWHDASKRPHFCDGFGAGDEDPVYLSKEDQ